MHPALRALAIASGAVLLSGARRGGASGLLFLFSGLGLTARGIRGAPLFRRARSRPVEMVGAVTIARPPDEVYRTFRDFERIPEVFSHVERVEEIDPGVFRWVVREGALRLTFRARVIADEPGARIAWQSLPGGRIDASGEITFRPAPGDRGTEMRARLRYAQDTTAPLLVVARALRRLGNLQLTSELARFKQLIEAGEIATNQMRPTPERPAPRRRADVEEAARYPASVGVSR